MSSTVKSDKIQGATGTTVTVPSGHNLVATDALKADTIQASSDDVLTIPSSLNVTGYSANVSGNVSVARSLVVGYTDGRTPQANLDVKGNAVIGTTVYVASNNTVGIGAMPHVGKLYVDSGGTSITGQFGSTSAATTYFRLGASGTTSYPQIAVNANDLTFRTSYANRMTIDSNGCMVMPTQPAFFAYNSVADLNVTGNAVTYTIVCDTEVFDQNADYNTGTGTFTAPVTGRYYLQAQCSTDAQTTTNTDGIFALVMSNRTQSVYYNPGNMEGPAATGQCSISISGLFDMDASDTATITVKIYQGTQTIGVQPTNTWFSGVLIA